MTNSTFHGATFLLAEEPTTERITEMVKQISDEHFPTNECRYSLAWTLPQGLPVDVADQLLAHQKDLGPSALFLLIEPLSTKKAYNGKIPS